ncbi:hypothetical protein VNO77_17148 [Canavalia gladiata]|uniref:Uncharacterized protein n=1 Tax=Canavalia gladiata TaxID=3824 RepID=A0AAN9QIH8_CANGL
MLGFGLHPKPNFPFDTRKPFINIVCQLFADENTNCEVDPLQWHVPVWSRNTETAKLCGNQPPSNENPSKGHLYLILYLIGVVKVF